MFTAKSAHFLFFIFLVFSCSNELHSKNNILPIAGGTIAAFAGGDGSIKLKLLYDRFIELDRRKLKKKQETDPDFTGTAAEIPDTKKEANERSRIRWQIRSLKVIIPASLFIAAAFAVFFIKDTAKKKPDETGRGGGPVGGKTPITGKKPEKNILLNEKYDSVLKLLQIKKIKPSDEESEIIKNLII